MNGPIRRPCSRMRGADRGSGPCLQGSEMANGSSRLVAATALAPGPACDGRAFSMRWTTRAKDGTTLCAVNESRERLQPPENLARQNRFHQDLTKASMVTQMVQATRRSTLESGKYKHSSSFKFQGRRAHERYIKYKSPIHQSSGLILYPAVYNNVASWTLAMLFN